MESNTKSDLDQGQSSEHLLGVFEKRINELFDKEIYIGVMDREVYAEFKKQYGYSPINVEERGIVSIEDKIKSFVKDDSNSQWGLDQFESLMAEREKLDEYKDSDRCQVIDEEIYTIEESLEGLAEMRIRSKMDEKSQDLSKAMNNAKFRGKHLLDELKETVKSVVDRLEQENLKIKTIEVAGEFAEPINGNGKLFSKEFENINVIEDTYPIHWVNSAARYSMPKVYIEAGDGKEINFEIMVADHEAIEGGAWVYTYDEPNNHEHLDESDYSILINENNHYNERAFEGWLAKRAHGSIENQNTPGR